jgi:hypothetical protein
MDSAGSLYIAWLNKGESREPVFAVRFVPNGYGTLDNVTTCQFLGEESLREFLVRSLFIGSDPVEAALLDLHYKGSAEFHSLNISDDNLRRFKLV